MSRPETFGMTLVYPRHAGKFVLFTGTWMVGHTSPPYIAVTFPAIKPVLNYVDQVYSPATGTSTGHIQLFSHEE